MCMVSVQVGQARVETATLRSAGDSQVPEGRPHRRGHQPRRLYRRRRANA